MWRSSRWSITGYRVLTAVNAVQASKPGRRSERTSSCCLRTLFCQVVFRSGAGGLASREKPMLKIIHTSGYK